MSGHTPGPWKFGKELGAHSGEWLISLDRGNHRGMCIAETRPGTGDEYANARIIASAPDMAEALRDFVAAISSTTANLQGLHIAVEKARAALAKAGVA